MNESQERFCQRLMAADPATPEFKAKYEKEMHMLFSDRKIEGMPKRKILVQTTISLAAGTVFTAAAVLAALGRNPLADIALERRLLLLIPGAAFFFAMAIYLIRLLKRGKVNLGTYNSTLEGLSWIFTVTVFGIFTFNSMTGAPGGLQLLGFGLGLLVFGGVNKIVCDVKRAELRTREKLLKLEYQFAELTEKLQSRRD
jgi:hypothetical protein